MTFRIGHGYDIHRFAEKAADCDLRLGGVAVPHTHPLEAHSDGDVIIHALCDALLGALALGDIGGHFPDSDPTLCGADSRELLRHVIQLIKEREWEPINTDITVLAEVPRIAPSIPAMRETLAGLMDLAADSLSIKATTTEGLGAIGCREGLAAHAVVLLHKQG